jgi:hypothetical protein
MKKYRFYVHFKGGDKATDWIYCDSEVEKTVQFLAQAACHNKVIDDNGSTHFIDWPGVQYAKCEEVK